MYTVVHYLYFSYNVIFLVFSEQCCEVPYGQLVYHVNLALTLQLIELYYFVWQSIKTRDLGTCL